MFDSVTILSSDTGKEGQKKKKKKGERDWVLNHEKGNMKAVKRFIIKANGLQMKTKK